MQYYFSSINEFRFTLLSVYEDGKAGDDESESERRKSMRRRRSSFSLSRIDADREVYFDEITEVIFVFDFL